MTVTGTAEASADPDQAVVRLGVLAESAEAAAAQGQVNRFMRQVLEAMTALGVRSEAVRTEQLSLAPVYGQPQVASRGEPGEPRITGYRASNVVSVRLEDLSKVGATIDAGIGAGANQLHGISFGLRDDTEARARALRAAVRRARAEAEAIAGAMGMRIAGVREIVAGGYDVRPPTPYAGARFAAAEFAATPVEPGEVDVSASVTVTFYVTDGRAAE